MLTLWVRDFLALSSEPETVSVHEFARFYAALWDTGTKTSAKISKKMRNSFLTFLSKATGLSQKEIKKNIEQTVETLFAEIEEEYGGVALEDIRPELFQLFLLED